MFIGFFKYLIVALVLLAGYNEFVIMHRPSAFNDITKHEDKAAVVQAIGEVKNTYHCGDTAPAFLPSIDSLCVDKVEEVDAFPLCYIALRCPGWYYVGFDKDNKVVARYSAGN